MENEKVRLYRWKGLHWNGDYDFNGNPSFYALCPKQKCNCRLIKSKEKYSIGEYKYCCVSCELKVTLNKSIEDKALDFANVLEALHYKDAEIINIDGDLIRVQREEKEDSDYWVDVKISKNKKNEVQLMVLAGSKNKKNKTQLFLDSKSERLTFDQNNDHPREIFAKVTATFKNSITKICSN